MKEGDKQELERIIRRAGESILSFWPPRRQSQMAVYEKDDGSPVTEADFASNKILNEGIRGIFPDDGIVSEEGTENEKQRAYECVWIIDPLDGTRWFLEGLDQFCVIVARTQRGQVNYGAMYFPVLNLFATAVRGAGAQLNGAALNVSTQRGWNEERLYFRGLTLRGVDNRNEGKINSGLAFLKLCRGELDGVVLEASRFGEHDVAAPAILVAESGGQVTDEAGNEITFNHERIPYRLFVASNGLVHGELLGRV